ncbi:NAD(P)-dependent oxidoreductase [Nocardioides sp.]|uniref:NAD(P)-dependent oxidoreductase n=1 Tax=Nocardioides sp. TaxID=35761 RepID=UPI0039E3DF42
MPRPVVLVAEPLHADALAALGDAEIRVLDGDDRAALLAAVPDATALLAGPHTVVDAELLAAAPLLKVVARAGVRLASIDVAAATQAGVLVVNAPASHDVSLAELAVGRVLAGARQVGIELDGRVAGVVGIGRVGALVAQRLAALGMAVIAHDPDTRPGRAARLGIRLTDLDTLLAEADVVSIHLPVEPVARPGQVLVAVEREYDEETAPVQAHRKAGLAVAGSVRLALAGELVPDAVNLQVGRVADEIRPGLPLAEKLGRILAALAGGVARRLDVLVRGEITEHDVRILEVAALTGFLSEVVEERVSYVNAPVLAAAREVTVRLLTDPESPDYRNLVGLRATLADGTAISVAGTLIGLAQRERLVELNGFQVDLEPTEHLAFLTYDDRPGVIGTVGRILGEAGINIAGMQVSRTGSDGHQQSQQLIAVCVDSAVPPDTLSAIAAAVAASSARAVDLR